jgi:hypothetical protein
MVVGSYIKTAILIPSQQAAAKRRAGSMYGIGRKHDAVMNCAVLSSLINTPTALFGPTDIVPEATFNLRIFSFIWSTSDAGLFPLISTVGRTAI